MIKINLLKALNQTSMSSSKETEAQETESFGFISKLFSSAKKLEQQPDVNIDDPPASPAVVILKVILMLSSVVGLMIYESINIPKLKQHLAESNEQLQILTAYNNKAAMAVAEIKKQQEYKTLIEKQIASLDGLSKVRLKYIKVLDLIQSNIPEKLWFTNLKTKDNLLEVVGLASSENEITNFLDVMGKSIFFSDVSLQSSEDVAGRDPQQRKYKKFNINFTLESNK